MSLGGGIRRRIKRLFYSSAQKRHELVGPAKLWKMKRDFQFDYLVKAGLKPGHYLMDLGCGTLRGGIPLIDYLEAGHYCGVESRAAVLDEGREELREANLADKSPVLVAAEDVSTLALDQRFDYVWAFSVLIHMTDEILDGAAGMVAAHLQDTGVFLANVNIGDDLVGNWQGFPVMHHPFEFYQGVFARHGLTVEDVGALGELGHHSGDEAQDRQRMLSITRVK